MIYEGMILLFRHPIIFQTTLYDITLDNKIFEVYEERMLNRAIEY